MNLPITAAKYFSFKYKLIVKKLLRDHQFDFVIIDHTQMSWTIPLLKKQKIAVIVHNFESDMYRLMGYECSNPLKKILFYLEARKLKKLEALIQNKAHSIWGLNISDLEPFNDLKYRTEVFKVYSFIDCSVQDMKPEVCENDYVAMLGLWSWLPNARALNWFLDKVLPLLPEDIKIIVGGKGAPNLPVTSGRVKFPGFIENANSFLLSAKVICIPSVDNVGIQIKSIDACASGLPTVATHIAFRGITDPPYFVQVHDDEKMFAEAIIRAFRFPNDRSQMLSAAIKWNEKRMKEFSQDLSSESNFLRHLNE